MALARDPSDNIVRNAVIQRFLGCLLVASLSLSLGCQSSWGNPGAISGMDMEPRNPCVGDQVTVTVMPYDPVTSVSLAIAPADRSTFDAKGPSIAIGTITKPTPDRTFTFSFKLDDKLVNGSWSYYDLQAILAGNSTPDAYVTESLALCNAAQPSTAPTDSPFPSESPPPFH